MHLIAELFIISEYILHTYIYILFRTDRAIRATIADMCVYVDRVERDVCDRSRERERHSV